MNNENIASIVKLSYVGKDIVFTDTGIDDGDPATPIPDPIHFMPKFMDDVFDLMNTISFLKADKIYHVHSYKPNLYSQKSIDKSRGQLVAYTQRTQNTIAVSETENLTLFTYLSISEIELSNHSNFSPTPSSNKEATGYGVQDLSEFQVLPNLPSNEFVKLDKFTDSGQTINGIVLNTYDNSLATTILLGITEDENNTLLDVIELNNLKNPKLYFHSSDDGNFNLSEEGVKYKKFTLKIVSENSDNNFLINNLNDDITIYSIDELIFFSKSYSENILIESVINEEISFTIKEE